MATANINPSVPRTLFPQRYEVLASENFETASIRSAAPSYISEAPSYHSQNIPNDEPAPPYSPSETRAATSIPSQPPNAAAIQPNRTPVPVLIPPPSGPNMVAPWSNTSSHIRTPSTAISTSVETLRDRLPTGLPPASTTPMTRAVPNLAEFRIPTIAANPSARHYVRVAQRRAAAAAAAADAGFAVRMLLGRVEEEEARRFRPLEDPYLVGVDEARRARDRRIGVRYDYGDIDGEEQGLEEHDRIPDRDRALEREGRRWDWFLGQVRESDERGRRSNSPRGGLFSGGGGGSGRPKKQRGGGRLALFGRR